MRVGILTLPFNNNYGGILQSFALQSFIRSRGHEVLCIKQPVQSKTEFLKLILKILFGKAVYINPAKFLKFQRDYMSQTKTIYRLQDLYKYRVHEYDAIVVGSDQVWRFKYTNDRFSMYFLDFISSNRVIKKISFAASFGVDFCEATKEQQAVVEKLLPEFDSVSVREESGIDLCRIFFNYDKSIRLYDPTLLYDANFYRKLYKGDEVSYNGKIGVYMLDSNLDKEHFISLAELKLSKESNLIGKYKSFLGFSHMSVEQWLYAFDTSDYIITDSFHGMIFSIIFKKQFTVIGNKERGIERFTSILREFNMLDRLLDEDSISSSQLVIRDFDESFLKTKILDNLKRSEFFLSKIEL